MDYQLDTPQRNFLNSSSEKFYRPKCKIRVSPSSHQIFQHHALVGKLHHQTAIQSSFEQHFIASSHSEKCYRCHRIRQYQGSNAVMHLRIRLVFITRINECCLISFEAVLLDGTSWILKHISSSWTISEEMNCRPLSHLLSTGKLRFCRPKNNNIWKSVRLLQQVSFSFSQSFRGFGCNFVD